MTKKNELRAFDRPVDSTFLAEYLGCEHVGSALKVTFVSDVAGAEPGAIFFQDKGVGDLEGVTSIVQTGLEGQLSPKCTYILSLNPKLDMARVVELLFAQKKRADHAEHAFIDNTAVIGENVRIGVGAVIEANVSILENSCIGANVVIKSGITIGKGCTIADGAIIGNDGLTTTKDEFGRDITFRHVGELVLGDNVEVGANATIGRATLGVATIGNNTIIGPQVNVGHNGCIGENVIVTGCSCIAGSAKIGDNSFIGANCSVKDGITIGKGCVIGIGSSVTKNVPDGATVTGFSAMSLRELQTARVQWKRDR